MSIPHLLADAATTNPSPVIEVIGGIVLIGGPLVSFAILRAVFTRRPVADSAIEVASINQTSAAPGILDYEPVPPAPPTIWDEPEPRESVLMPLGLLTMWFAILVLATALVAELLKRSGRFSAETGAVLASLLGTPFAPAVVWLLNARLRSDGPRRLGVRLQQIGPGLVIGAIGLVATIPWVLWMNVIMEVMLKHFHSAAPTEHEIFQLWQTSGGAGVAFRIAAILSAVIAAPMAEETAFRGLLQPIIRRLTGRPSVAVILTAAMFAAIHQPWTITPSIFVLAVGLGLAYEKTRNLWAVIAMHALFNASEFALFLSQVG
jgi:membrane protease YdiL (CAAX protease family)